MGRIEELESRVSELDAELSELLEESEVEPEVDEEGKEKAVTPAEAVRALREESAAIAYNANAEAARLRALADSIAEKEKELRAAKSELNREKVRLFGKLDKDGALNPRGLIHEKREALREEEARSLILKKLKDLVVNETDKYLRNERLRVVSILERLWDKYVVSLKEISKSRDAKLQKLDRRLKALGYGELG
jgi:type I restriction enzyme M protein